MKWLNKLFGIHKCDFTNQPTVIISGYKFVKCKHCNTYDPVDWEEEMARQRALIAEIEAYLEKRRSHNPFP